jgi:hypothetical protein
MTIEQDFETVRYACSDRFVSDGHLEDAQAAITRIRAENERLRALLADDALDLVLAHAREQGRPLVQRGVSVKGHRYVPELTNAHDSLWDDYETWVAVPNDLRYADCRICGESWAACNLGHPCDTRTAAPCPVHERTP